MVLVLLLFIDNACKKSVETTIIDQQKLEEWYNKNVSVKNIPFNDLKPIWKSVTTKEDVNKIIVYEVELSNPKQVYQKLSTSINNKEAQLRNSIHLLIFKDQTTNKFITGCYMSVLNEGKEIIKLNNVHYKQAVGLSGKIMFFNMNGDLQNGWEHYKGVITKRINGSLEGYYYGNKNALSDLKDPALVERKDVGMNKLMIYVPPACAFPQPNYKTACVGVEGYMERSTYLSGYICADGAESGGGGGYVPTPIGGGNGGGGGSPQAPKVVDVDPDARQCLKDIKAALEGLGMKNTATGSGLIANVLNKLNLSTGSDFKAVITEGVIAPKNIAATTWESDQNGNRITQIKFSEDYLNKSTDLKMAGTMMHEYVHAYFEWNLYLMKSGSKTYDANFEKTYKLLFDESGAQLNDPFGTLQHEQIAKSFVKEIATMLKSYAINQNIPLPADPLYFEKIGWGGLFNTSLYKYAPDGTIYTNSAEAGNNSTTITQTLKCKK